MIAAVDALSVYNPTAAPAYDLEAFLGDWVQLNAPEFIANGAAPPREWGVEEGESVIFNVGKGFNMIFKTSCSTSE